VHAHTQVSFLTPFVSCVSHLLLQLLPSAIIFTTYLGAMLGFSWRRLCSTSLTDSVATHGTGSRGVHRPKVAVQEQLKHRLRQRRQQRSRNIAAKAAEVQRSIENVTSSRDLLVGQLADQIFARGHRHVASATNVGFVPDGNPATPLVALAGRETCGKTALLRSLFRSAGEVGRSNRQLRRDAMNFFNVGDVFNVADLPGCGGTSVPWSTVLQHAVLLRNFVRYQPSLKMLYYCMDVHYKHGVYVQDIDLLRFLAREVPNFTIVITKADQINDRAIRTVHMEDVRRELLYNDIHHPVLVTSAFHMGGVDTLRYDIVMNCLHALPTERLTLTEARRLSARLFSQTELSTIRPLAIAPSFVEDERQAWLAGINRTERDGHAAAASAPDSSACISAGEDNDPANKDVSGFDVTESSTAVPDVCGEGDVKAEEGVDEVVNEDWEHDSDGDVHHRTRATDEEEYELLYSDAESEMFSTTAEVETPDAADKLMEHHTDSAATAHLTDETPLTTPDPQRLDPGTSLPHVAKSLLQTDAAPAIPVVYDDPVMQVAYERAVKTLRNKPLLRYVDATSPWRNPLRWPRHVVPTKHPKSNIVRCPEAPENPYLFQSQFVAPRADMCFRRPNIGVRKSSQKGRYEADRPIAFLMKHYTIPYFPDIVDTAMQPTAWAFLGSREAYYERNGGRQLGVRLLNYATAGTVNSLSDNPAPAQPELAKEVQQLEAKRYGVEIAMLRPPELQPKEQRTLPLHPPQLGE
jgi:GTP-binding protein EngB required for normal cell division